MIDYYKKFFDHNISSVFLCELRQPVALDLPVNQQVELIFEHGYVKDINQTTLEMYFGKGHRDKSIIVNQKVSTVWKERDYKNESGSVYQFFKKFVENNYYLRNIESEAETPKKEKVWFLVSMNGIVENGHLMGWWGSQLDISELKLTQQTLEVTNRLLRNKIEEIEGFTYLSSHNLQTPLHNIQNFSALVLQEHANQIDQIGKTHLNYINDSARKLSFMYQRLVAYFDLDGRHTQTHIDTRDLIHGILQSSFKESQDKIELGELPLVLGDYDKVKLLFSLLIENSFIHNPKTHNLKISIDSLKFDKHTEFRVTDNGVGISARDNPKIFKINKTNLDYTKGLGLAMAKKIVTQHQGEIWVNSVPHEKTTFFFTLANTPI